MTTPFKSLNWALWVQPDGPNTQIYYLGCHTLDDVEVSLGGIKDIIRCYNADGTGWTTRMTTRNPPEAMTTSVTGIIEETASWLEHIIEEANCPFPLYVNGKKCPPLDVFGGAERWYTMENAEITALTLSGLSHREEDNISEQTFEIAAWPPMVYGRDVDTDEVTNSGTNYLQSIDSCSTPRCVGECGAAVARCDTLVAVGDSAAAPAFAATLLSEDHGVTWAAMAADPAAAGVDLRSVRCFAIDSDTTRILVAREQIAATPMHVYYSDDSGANWTDVTLASTNAYGPYGHHSLCVLDMYHIWLVIYSGGSSEVFFSSDGGETWTEQTFVAMAGYAVHFSDPLNGVIVGSASNLASTSDGGETWTLETNLGTGDSLLCVTENAGGGIWWLGTSDNDIYYSTDAGVTWERRLFPGTEDSGYCSSMDWVSPTVGYLTHYTAGGAGRVLRTRNGGLSWEIESEWFSDRLKAIRACSTNEAFAVGGDTGVALIVHTHE
jgi:photosystem II stability/assembly factor-like uncharacterized protein